MASIVACGVALGILLFQPPASARAEVAVGISAGTLGIGGELVVGTPRLQGRFGFSTLDVDVDFDTGFEYEGELQLENFAAIVDWYPSAGGFRLSAGLVVNDNRLVGTSSFGQLLSAEDLPPGVPLSLLDELGFLRAEAGFDELVPYLGLGFGNPLGADGRWQVRLDLGLLGTGKPDVLLDAVILLPIEIPAEIQQLIDSFLAEEQRELEDEIGDVDVYPVITLGLSYRF